MTGSAGSSVGNCLSIDVEGFAESKMQHIRIPDEFIDREKELREIEQNTRCVLQLLREFNIEATFFFIAKIARQAPDIVKAVSAAGHEIGCHSYEHVRIPGVGKDEFKEKLAEGKALLEEVSGKRVYGFRAPDFSITESSVWALDIIKELGFDYDSSIYPIGSHDVYGIKGAQTRIHLLRNGLIEFPLSTVQLLGRRLPFGGGGYFRLYPILITKVCIAVINRVGEPCMFYIHPYEVGTIIPKIPGLSFYRRFRHYYNCKNGIRRLTQIIKAFEFKPAIQLLKSRGLV